MMRGVDHPVEWLLDVSPAEWIRAELHGFAADVGSLVPEGFGAYARVFHPVLDLRSPSQRWSEIARANGRVPHREIQLHMINRPAGSPVLSDRDRGEGFDNGSLPLRERAALVETLRPATSTPHRCWFCIWEGFGGLDDLGVSARVRLPGRNYVLARGPIEWAIDSFLPLRDQSANLWWPEDRAWVVTSEIDLAWTYVAATAAVVDALVADARIEAMEALITDRFTFDADVVNQALDRG
jgi:hypothetical protein